MTTIYSVWNRDLGCRVFDMTFRKGFWDDWRVFRCDMEVTVGYSAIGDDVSWDGEAT